MQPYQRAAEAIRSGEEAPIHLLKNAGLTAIGGGAAAIGSKAASKLIPAIGSLINEYIPENLAIKGLGKVDSRFGKFIEGAMGDGYSFDDIRQLLGDKIKKTQESETVTNDPLKFFETNYPDVAAALAKTMQNGQSPEAAAAILKTSTPFGKEVKKIEKETDKNFVDYILELFGNQGQQMQQPKQQMQGQQQMQQSSQQQGSGVDAQLMAALDKILKM